ncbi:MAG: alpha/beta hydrolase [Chitinophagaceae bacterium]
MTEKDIRIQNKQIHYKVSGKGIPVVLVHGFAEDNDVWKYQQDVLSEHYQLIIPDLPGSGQSGMTGDMSIDGLADVVKQILDHESVKSLPPDDGKNMSGIVMIGHSMGGYITLAFAEKYPAMLRGFGLFHSTAFADSDERKAIRRRGIAFIQTHGSYEFIKQSAPNLFTEDYRIKNNIIVAEMITRYSSFDPLALVAYYEAMIQRPDRTTVLQSFNKPILFIIGKKDKAISFEDSLKQCHIPAQASIQILENAAHMGMWEEKKKSTQALLTFLQDATV